MKTLLIAGYLYLAAGASFAWQAAAPQSDPLKATDKKKASIEGQVVNLNTGATLKKANVLLIKMGGRTGPVSAATDDSGQFVFRDLEKGQYQMMAERAGYVRQFYGARGNQYIGTMLTLNDGQELKGIVFKLAPQSVIAGKVVDEDGEPIPNVTVMALRTMYDRGRKTFLPLGTAQSSDLGEYRLANLGPGKYIISATYRSLTNMIASSGAAAAKETDQDYTTTFYPNVLESDSAAPVPVGTGAEVRAIDIHMAKTKVVRVKGKVIDSDAGKEKTLIVFMTRKGSGTMGLVTRPMAISTGKDGLFEVKGVSPGSYIISVASAQNAMQTSATQALEVGENNIDNVVLTVAPGAEMKGTVKVEEKTPLDLKNVSVALTSADVIETSPPKASPDDQGAFTLKGISALRYLVSVTGLPDSCYVKAIKFGGQEVDSDVGIDLSGGTPAALEILLSTAAAEVDGAVTDRDNKPVAGASVALIPKDGKYAHYRSATTDQNGAFTLKNLTPGEYKAFAWEDIEMNAYQDPEFVKTYDSLGTELKLKENGRESPQMKIIPAADKK